MRIKSKVKETPLVTTFTFDYPHRAEPGQFINVWLPGVNERPMSIAFDDGKAYTISVAAVGEFTKLLGKKKVGDMLGIRGPYGQVFTWKPKQRIAMLAGGYGVAPLYFAASRALKDGCKIDFFHGARSKDHLLFAQHVPKLKNTRYLPATDDGSAGFHGYNVQAWQEELSKGVAYDLVMTCGPEVMMKVVSDRAFEYGIDAQISVERYMKCGFGVCGNCTVDDLGITTCQKGTVMPNETVRKIKEFGKYHRDAVGRKHLY